MKSLIVDNSSSAAATSSLLQEFTGFQIQQVLNNCDKIKTQEHVEGLVGVWRKAHSKAVLLAMHETFGDIEPSELERVGGYEEDDRDFEQDWIKNNIVKIPFPTSIQENTRTSRRTDISYRQLQANVNAFGMSFIPRTIRTWNLVSGDIAALPSLQLFQAAALPALRSKQAPGYMRRL
ncbi:predicted protein [Nematostella vectensis]|uniref:Uncharacterized protein n=1 Tax=Nematostella vectensis TaxID=45351 RepID=A7RS88_NEMVE|nr:predicted protein [Nematostella vectensis]|eukprot:XP_001637764.1 predicted protein [Nematostella vectensis]